MKYFLSLLIIFLSLVVFVKQQNRELVFNSHPRPTNGIEIPENMEDGSTKDLKKAWFEAIHSCASETDWRKIENNNTLNKYENYRNSRSHNSISLNGQVQGRWEEKGSKNQAGSIIKTAYNKITDKIVAISDGGSLWTGKINGTTWSVVEDQLQFDGRFLDIVYPEANSYRTVSYTHLTLPTTPYV